MQERKEGGAEEFFIKSLLNNLESESIKIIHSVMFVKKIV